jgi:hypothetical protein
MSRRDCVGIIQREGHGFLKFGSDSDLVEKLEEATETAKGRDGFSRWNGFGPVLIQKQGQNLSSSFGAKGESAFVSQLSFNQTTTYRTMLF